MFELEDRWLRETYVDCLIEAAKQDDRIVILEADLSNPYLHSICYPSCS